jgi:hypothetical protein
MGSLRVARVLPARIIVIPGANGSLPPADLSRYERLFQDASIILSQLEIPLETVEEIARTAERLNVPFLLDPATTLPLTPERRDKRAALLNYFSLFSSFSTLICCTLPSVLVLLGMETAFASLLSAVPWLVSLSRHKIWTFGIAGTLICCEPPSDVRYRSASSQRGSLRCR